VKIVQGIRLDLRGVCIPHCDEIAVKTLVLGSYTLIFAPIGVKFGVDERKVLFLHAKCHPIGATCRPCGAKKTSKSACGELPARCAARNAAGNNIILKNFKMF